jgi:hypothetical protein
MRKDCGGLRAEAQAEDTYEPDALHSPGTPHLALLSIVLSSSCELVIGAELNQPCSRHWSESRDAITDKIVRTGRAGTLTLRLN